MPVLPVDIHTYKKNSFPKNFDASKVMVTFFVCFQCCTETTLFT